MAISKKWWPRGWRKKFSSSKKMEVTTFLTLVSAPGVEECEYTKEDAWERASCTI